MNGRPESGRRSSDPAGSIYGRGTPPAARTHPRLRARGKGSVDTGAARKPRAPGRDRLMVVGRAVRRAQDASRRCGRQLAGDRSGAADRAVDGSATG